MFSCFAALVSIPEMSFWVGLLCFHPAECTLLPRSDYPVPTITYCGLKLSRSLG
jgi:hypothetical protein